MKRVSFPDNCVLKYIQKHQALKRKGGPIHVISKALGTPVWKTWHSNLGATLAEGG